MGAHSLRRKAFLFVTSGKSHQNPPWIVKQVSPERKISHCWQISNVCTSRQNVEAKVLNYDISVCFINKVVNREEIKA